MAEVKDLVIQLSLENDKLKKQLVDTGNAGKKASKSIGDAFADAQKKILAGLAAFTAIKGALNFSKEFAAFRQAADSTERQFGINANTIIDSLNKVAKGTISNTDLIQSANKAMALNVTRDVGQMAKILEVARVRGQALGLDTRQAFEDLVTGIGRNSPLILDNLGIITKGWAEEAAAAGVAYDSQFILNKVLEDGGELLKRTGDIQVTTAERFQQVEAAIKNARVELGEAMLPVIETFAPIVTDLVEGFGKLPDNIKKVGVAVSVVTPLMIALNAALGPIGLAIAGIAIATSAAIIAYNKYKKATEGVADVEAERKKEIENIRAEINKYKNDIKQLEKEGKKFEELGIFGKGETAQVIKESQEAIKKLEQRLKELTEAKKNDTESTNENTNAIVDNRTEEEKLTDAKKKQADEEKRKQEIIDAANAQLSAYGTNVQAVTSAILNQGGAASELVKQFIELGVAIGQAASAQEKMKAVQGQGADQTKVNIQATSDWVTLIIKLVSALGKAAEESENAAVRGFGQFIAATQDLKTILGTLFPVITTISDAVNGVEDAWINLIPVVGPLIQKFRRDVSETTDAVTEKVGEMITSIEQEIERANFRIEIQGIDEAEAAALRAAEIESGLTALKAAEAQDRIEDLDEAIAQETDLEKKSDLQRQRDLIDAQAEYEKKRQQIQEEADEKRAEVKKREFEYEIALRKAQIEIDRTNALAEVSKKGTKKQKKAAKKEVNADYDELVNLIDSIPMPQYAQGGVISGLPGIGPEDGYIAAQNGESVLNRNATAILGKDAIDALNSGKNISPTTVNITVMDGRGAVEVLNQYFRTQGTSSRGLSL